jgi:hypothetical protein
MYSFSYRLLNMSSYLAVVAVSTSSLTLVGCNSAQRTGIPSMEKLRASAREMRRLDELAALGKISHVEATRRKKLIALEGAAYSPEVEEIWAKELVIAKKFDNKELTQIQAEALSAEKTANLVRRNRPISTSCNQVGSRQIAPPISLSHRQLDTHQPSVRYESEDLIHRAARSRGLDEAGFWVMSKIHWRRE